MVVLDQGVIIGLAIGGVVLVVIILVIIICCLCRKCDQCARWSRRKAYEKEETRLAAEREVKNREYDTAHQEREAARNQIRAKYNLNGYNDNLNNGNVATITA